MATVRLGWERKSTRLGTAFIACRWRRGAVAARLGWPSTIFRLCLVPLLLGPWLLRRQLFDVVFVYAPSPITQAIPAVWLAFIKRAKLVTWVQDLWPQSLEATGFVLNRRVLAMVAVMVTWNYRHCDLLLVQSRSL